MAWIETDLPSLFHETAIVPAPAKLNLRLKIEGRRPDGYHLLSMLNVTTTLCDELHLSLTREPGCEVTIAGVVEKKLSDELLDAEKNLAARAAMLFISAFSLECGLKIHLEKRIPAGGGMGGGSSDAAAVLRWLAACVGPSLLQKLYIPAPQFQETLQRIALKLGADVPYLLQGGLACVSGIGELVEPLDGAFLHGVPCFIVDPGVSLGTRHVFETFRDLEFNTGVDVEAGRVAHHLAQSSDPYNYLTGLIDNDLVPAALASSGKLREIYECLAELPGSRMSMTGSGSGLFLLPEKLEGWKPGLEKELVRRVAGMDIKLIGATLIGKGCFLT